jgi:hypothetical protein
LVPIRTCQRNPGRHRQQIEGVGIGADGSGVLGTGQQCGDRASHPLVPAVEQCRAVACLVVRESKRQRPLGGNVGDEGPQPVEERIRGRIYLEQSLPLGTERRHLVGVDGDDEVAARREPTVEGRVADPRPAGDLVERRVDADLGEDLLRRFQQPLPVPPGVCPSKVALAGA